MKDIVLLSKEGDLPRMLDSKVVHRRFESCYLLSGAHLEFRRRGGKLVEGSRRKERNASSTICSRRSSFTKKGRKYDICR